jgi:hypothetical protein
MPSDIDLDPPISHAIANVWADFAQTILPGIGGSTHAQAHIAFHFGAMYVLQIALHMLAERPGEEAALFRRLKCSRCGARDASVSVRWEVPPAQGVVR